MLPNPRALLQWIAATLVAAISLSIGSGALHVGHAVSHAHGGTACDRHDPSSHCHAERATPCDHSHDEPSDAPSRDVPESDDCGTCVILAIAGSAPTCVPAPIVFVTSIESIADVAEAIAPAPCPLKTLAARPPPIAIA
ncbi:MAG: hypothetical protein JNM94_06840 [Phycisphaerae bacterium]|nr:hypothetical protein [Phycisphaerae bacterium]